MRTPVADAPPARAVAVRKLAVDAMTCEVLRAFAADAVEAILLKGVTLQRPLYGDERTRAYGDADLLVDPVALPRARASLERIGFELRLDLFALPFRAPDPHSEDWRRGRDAVDLHWRLPGVDAPPDAAWRALTRHTQRVTLGTETVDALDTEGMALLLALHAARHGTLAQKPLEDLRRGLDRFDRATWSRAALLARELDALDSFGAGLRTVPAGAALAAFLAVSEARSDRVRLKAGAQPPAALGVLTVLETPWRGGKGRAVVNAVAPSRAFMRASFPLARRGRVGLALAYGVRAANRARQLPVAVRAVRRARST